MYYLICKSLHIIGVVSWFAGLFYLVRLFVYYRESLDRREEERSILTIQLSEMINRLFRIITTPAMILTVIAGSIMLILQPVLLQAPWMHAKLGLVLILLIYHYYCYRIIKTIEKRGVLWKSFQFRLFNEIATLLLVAIVFLVVMKNAFNALYGILGFFLFGVIIFIAAKMYKKRRESKINQN